MLTSTDDVLRNDDILADRKFVYEAELLKRYVLHSSGLNLFRYIPLTMFEAKLTWATDMWFYTFPCALLL